MHFCQRPGLRKARQMHDVYVPVPAVIIVKHQAWVSIFVRQPSQRAVKLLQRQRLSWRICLGIRRNRTDQQIEKVTAAVVLLHFHSSMTWLSVADLGIVQHALCLLACIHRCCSLNTPPRLARPLHSRCNLHPLQILRSVPCAGISVARRRAAGWKAG